MQLPDLDPLGKVRTVETAHTIPIQEEDRFTCTDLGSDYFFFNHGSLFNDGGLDPLTADPVSAWYLRDPEPGVISRHSFPQRVFRGLAYSTGDGTFDTTLFGIRKDKLDGLLVHLCSTQIVDPEAKVLKRAYYKVVDVPDPALVTRQGRYFGMPKVEVVLILIDGSDSLVDVDSKGPVPRVYRTDPRAETVALASMFFGGGYLATSAVSPNAAHDAFLRPFLHPPQEEATDAG